MIRRQFALRASAVIVLLIATLVGGARIVRQREKGESPPAWPTSAQTAKAPYEAGVRVGRTYPYALYTHCGVRWTRIDGAWWETAPLNDGSANPPSAWGNPYDFGAVRLVSRDVAEYVGQSKQRARFTRTTERDNPSPPCM